VTAPDRTTDSSAAERVLVVGSSPMLLMAALGHHRRGANVTVAEARSRLGGAWATTHVPGLGDVETACHILESDGVVYEWLVKEVGLELTTAMQPPICVVWGNHAIPIGSTRFRIVEALFVPSSAASQLLRAWRTPSGGARNVELARTLAECAHDSRRILRRLVGRRYRTANLYFSAGPQRAFDTIADELRSGGSEVLVSTATTSIEACGHTGAVTVQLGDHVEIFDLVLVSSGLAHCSISRDSHPIEFETWGYDNDHLLVSITGASRDSGYVQFLADRHVRRMMYLPDPESGQESTGVRHALVQLRRGATTEEALGALEQRGMVDHDAAVQVVGRFRYRSHRTQFARHLSGSGVATTQDNLRFLDSYGDLVHNLAVLDRSAPGGLARLAGSPLKPVSPS